LQEAVADPPYVAFAIRPNPGIWEFVKVSSEDLSVEAITPTDFLKFKERVNDEKWCVISLHFSYISDLNFSYQQLSSLSFSSPLFAFIFLNEMIISTSFVYLKWHDFYHIS